MIAKGIKYKSEERIWQLGLEPNNNLPVLKDLGSLEFKSGEHIARRILILGYLNAISFDVKRKVIKEELNTYDLWEYVSEDEKKLLNKFRLTDQDRSNAAFLSEAIEALGWTLGLWSNIDPFNPCDEDKHAHIVPVEMRPIEFIDNSVIIEKERIYEEADFIYRLSAIANKSEIGNFSGQSNEVYKQRSKALNWVAGINEDWDD